MTGIFAELNSPGAVIDCIGFVSLIAGAIIYIISRIVSKRGNAHATALRNIAFGLLLFGLLLSIIALSLQLADAIDIVLLCSLIVMFACLIAYWVMSYSQKCYKAIHIIKIIALISVVVYFVAISLFAVLNFSK